MKNPLSTEAFADWCSKQTGKYAYGSNDDCAIAQYLKSLGFTDVLVSGFGVWGAIDASGKPVTGKLWVVASAAVRCETFEQLTFQLTGVS